MVKGAPSRHPACYKRRMNSPHRSLSVTALAVLAGIAGVLSLVDAARYMDWVPVPALGPLRFFVSEAAWVGAVVAAVVGVLFFLTTSWLWDLNPTGWLLVVVTSLFNTVFLLAALLGGTQFRAILPTVFLSVVVLGLALNSGTREAIGTEPTLE